MTTVPEILYEDSEVAVVFKPTGMLTEGSSSHGEASLEAWAMGHWDERARCCHRLDRATSGAILIRKTRRWNAELAEIFAKRRIRKTYWALVEGVWPNTVTSIKTPIAASSSPKGRQEISEAGRPAHTTVRVLGSWPEGEISWLQLILKTGRTHQARVHCASVGCPILGDVDYGAKPHPAFFGLHAQELRFTHPATGKSLQVAAPPPESWQTTLAAMDSPK